MGALAMMKVTLFGVTKLPLQEINTMMLISSQARLRGPTPATCQRSGGSDALAEPEPHLSTLAASRSAGEMLPHRRSASRANQLDPYRLAVSSPPRRPHRCQSD